ncbi:hypothetical protein HDC93_006788 [Streptomyces sp. AK010]|nr:hypothetical protein [Streptomyces sp. AK010]
MALYACVPPCEGFAAPARPERVRAVKRLPTDAAARPNASIPRRPAASCGDADENAGVAMPVRAATAAGLAPVLTGMITSCPPELRGLRAGG